MKTNVKLEIQRNHNTQKEKYFVNDSEVSFDEWKKIRDPYSDSLRKIEPVVSYNTDIDFCEYSVYYLEVDIVEIDKRVFLNMEKKKDSIKNWWAYRARHLDNDRFNEIFKTSRDYAMIELLDIFMEKLKIYITEENDSTFKLNADGFMIWFEDQKLFLGFQKEDKESQEVDYLISEFGECVPLPASFNEETRVEMRIRMYNEFLRQLIVNTI